MAYTPINWQTGDTITAEKLNKCDNGWSVESSSTTLCEESVTTATGDMGIPEAVLSYSSEITADTLIITLNGTDYTCPKKFFSETYFYGGFDTDNGAPDFSTYPFFLWSNANSGTNTLYTESAGSYTVAIGIPTTTVEVSDNFATAAQTAVADVVPLKVEFDVTTWQEVYDAMAAGRMVYVVRPNFRRIEPVIYTDSSAYSIICLSYSSGNLTTITYNAYPSSADSPIVEH